MNHEVPQPTTATRSPGVGRAAEGARAAARCQHSGCVAISSAVIDIELVLRRKGGDPLLATVNV
jgi:hypothetical protein